MSYLIDTNIIIYYFNGLTDDKALHTILLKQEFKTKTPDAIIAATALVNELTVITNNTSDFTRLGVKTLAVHLK